MSHKYAPADMTPEQAWKHGWRRYSSFKWWAAPFFYAARLFNKVAARGIIIEWRHEP